MSHKAGFVNIGNPNVGKSTLMNACRGKILSLRQRHKRPRHRILGIVNGEDFQMILSDTQELLACIRNASIDDELCKVRFEDADILIYMVEIESKI
jgi:GTP-binding protein Era